MLGVPHILTAREVAPLPDVAPLQEVALAHCKNHSMATQVTPPRGMRDFLPADKARRERILGIIRHSYAAHGFDEIETPVMEESDRLHAGLGGDNEKLAYAVMKRGLTANDLSAATEPLGLADLGLRFDLTVPLARFYATHRGQLPTVFRSIQIAPVWRAEKPQKGRYRQFVQCDIDIIGEAGPIAEVELLSATAATLDALGLEGCVIRVNDRRLLISALTIFGFASEQHEGVLITLDKLDKIGQDGVIAELRERAYPDGPVAALEEFFRRPMTMEYLSFGEAAIRKFLPQGVDPVAVAELAAIGLAVEEGRGTGLAVEEGRGTGLAVEEGHGTGLAVEAGRGTGHDSVGAPHIQFDPWLVRGMGYYTGAIFEVVHPSLGYSLGGGGRYDGMIGRFLGTDVPAAGFSLGFERIVDLVNLAERDGADAPTAVVLIHDDAVPPALLVALQSALVGKGTRTRLERKPRNMAPLLDQLSRSGFTAYAFVDAASTAETLEFRPIASTQGQ